MKNLKTIVLSLGLLSTTFVALGYFCEKCRVNHERLSDCRAKGTEDETFRNYITSVVKDAIRKQGPFRSDAYEVFGIIHHILKEKEFELLYRDFFSINWSKERIQQTRDFMLDVEKQIHNYESSHTNFMPNLPINWDEVFGSDCKSAPGTTDPEDKNDVFNSDNWEYPFGY